MVKLNEPVLDNTSTLSGIADGVKPMEPPKLYYPNAHKSNPKSQTPIWDNLDNTTGSSILLGKDGEMFSGYRSSPGGAFRHISAGKYDELPKYTGWKIHLSVDIDDLPKATEIIAREAIAQGVNDFKVAYRDLDAFAANPTQEGKMFTFYDRGEDWSKILPALEQKMTEAGIKSGASVPVDKNIKSSNYFAYRFDNDVDGGKYIPARDVLNKPNGHNPLKLEDKFEKIEIPKRLGLKRQLQEHSIPDARTPTKDILYRNLYNQPSSTSVLKGVRGNIAAAIGIAAIESAIDPNAVKEKIDAVDQFAQAGAQEKADIAAQTVRETALGAAELGVAGTAQSVNIAHRLIGNPTGVINEVGREIAGSWKKTADYVAEQDVGGIASDIGEGIVQGTKNVMDVLGHAGGAVGKALDRDPLISGRGKTTPEMQEKINALFHKDGLKQRLENQSAVETPHLPTPNQHREPTPQPTHGLATKQLVER